MQIPDLFATADCFFNDQEVLRTIVLFTGPLSTSLMLQTSRRFAFGTDCISVAQNGELIISCAVHADFNTGELLSFFPVETFDSYSRMWSPLPSLPFRQGSLLAVFGRILHSFGGADPFTGAISSVVSRLNLIERNT